MKAHVATRGIAIDQSKPQGIGAKLFNNRQGVNAVAERLAHLAPLLVAHDAVDEDMREGHLTG